MLDKNTCAKAYKTRNGALTAMDRCNPHLESVESVLVDGGYTGQPFADGVMARLKATVQVVKRNDLHTFVVLPKRWIVERSFGWLEKCRRLWRNCERKLNTSLQMVYLAFLALLDKRLWTGSKKHPMDAVEAGKGKARSVHLDLY